MRVVHWFYAYAVYVARAAAEASNMWFWWTVFSLALAVHKGRARSFDILRNYSTGCCIVYSGGM